MVIIYIILFFLAILVVAMIATTLIIIIDSIAVLPVLSFYLLFIEHNYDKAEEQITNLMSHHFILFPLITIAVTLLCISIGYYSRVGILMILSNVLAALVFEAGDVKITWYIFVPVGILALVIGLFVSRIIESIIPCLTSVRVQRITSGIIGIFGIFIGLFGYWFMCIGNVSEKSDMTHIIITTLLSIVLTVFCVFFTEKYIVTKKRTLE